VIDRTDPASATPTFVSVISLQFFSDPSAAIQETYRVLVDGGRVALSVWQGID
jgi:ubiquinone/menaquinone biosynthesis C-methylase UbiE